jgi:hypothetical protein
LEAAFSILAHSARLARLAGFAVAAACAACAGASPFDEQREETAGRAAAETFSTDAFCPVDRVATRRLVYEPDPPPAIALDPDRLALWKEVWEARAVTRPSVVVSVAGCGVRATYACWVMAPHRVDREGRIQSRRVVVGATCLDTAGIRGTGEP